MITERTSMMMMDAEEENDEGNDDGQMYQLLTMAHVTPALAPTKLQLMTPLINPVINTTPNQTNVNFLPRAKRRSTATENGGNYS